jgi:hypothetical protein
MGSRIGYRAKSKEGVSPLLRKQWMSSIEEGVTKTWKTLTGGMAVDDGMCALRSDLSWHRTFAVMVNSFYSPPFDEICDKTNCDISDNGLIEVDITNYKNWEINHYDVNWDDGTLSKKKKIATMTAKGFKWVITPKQRENLGEGLE